MTYRKYRKVPSAFNTFGYTHRYRNCDPGTNPIRLGRSKSADILSIFHPFTHELSIFGHVAVPALPPALHLFVSRHLDAADAADAASQYSLGSWAVDQLGMATSGAV